MSIDTKYPDIEVKLTGHDGNAFAVMGRVARALKQAGHADEVGAYTAEAMSGDYDNLLRVSAQWVSVR